MAKFFNTNLKHIRQNKGISQQELADKIGTDRSTISRWENGEIDTPLEMAMKISEVLDIPYYDFFGKDLTTNENQENSKLDILYSKTKDILSDDDRATIEFIMNKRIQEYEKNKNRND